MVRLAWSPGPDSSVGRINTDSRGLGSNPSLIIQYYFSHLITFGAETNPWNYHISQWKVQCTWVVNYEGKDHLRCRNLTVRQIWLPVSDRSASQTSDRFRGLNWFYPGLVLHRLFLPLLIIYPPTKKKKSGVKFFSNVEWTADE